MIEELAIEVDGLSKQYARATENFWALKDISFQVRKGEMLGIIGANGSGKSTLLKILSGIVKPTSGTAVIHGSYSSVLDVGSGFHPDLTGLQNIKLKAELLSQGRDLNQRVIDEILEFSGLAEFINEPVKNYSSGMFVRLAFSIFRSLKHDILLIDEVLSAGDLEFQSRIRNSGLLHQASGIIVSHELEAVAQYCDRILVLKKGKIVEVTDAQCAITNYRKSQNSNLQQLLLNRSQIPLGRIVQDDFEVSSIRLISSTFPVRLLESDKIQIGMELKNLSNSDKEVLVITFVRTLGIQVDLHADSPSIWKDGAPFKLKASSSLQFSFEYPSNFFGKGIYSVGLVIASPERLMERMEDLAFFEVEGEEWESDKLWSGMFLQNRTKLNWNVHSVQNDQA